MTTSSCAGRTSRPSSAFYSRRFVCSSGMRGTVRCPGVKRGQPPTSMTPCSRAAATRQVGDRSIATVQALERGAERGTMVQY